MDEKKLAKYLVDMKKDIERLNDRVSKHDTQISEISTSINKLTKSIEEQSSIQLAALKEMQLEMKYGRRDDLSLERVFTLTTMANIAKPGK